MISKVFNIVDKPLTPLQPHQLIECMVIGLNGRYQSLIVLLYGESRHIPQTGPIYIMNARNH